MFILYIQYYLVVGILLVQFRWIDCNCTPNTQLSSIKASLNSEYDVLDDTRIITSHEICLSHSNQAVAWFDGFLPRHISNLSHRKINSHQSNSVARRRHGISANIDHKGTVCHYNH